MDAEGKPGAGAGDRGLAVDHEEELGAGPTLADQHGAGGNGDLVIQLAMASFLDP